MNAELFAPPLDALTPDALPPKREMTLEEFERWNPEPSGVKYEWKDGHVIFGESSMNQTERHIVVNLMDAFGSTEAYAKGGRMLPETDCFLAPRGGFRRPDLAFFTREQLFQSTQARNPVPPLAIEIVSEHDDYKYHEDKLREYLAAGVQIVWQIVPWSRCVRGWHADGRHFEVLGAEEFSAVPVIPDLKLTPDQVFRLPTP